MQAAFNGCFQIEAGQFSLCFVGVAHVYLIVVIFYINQCRCFALFKAFINMVTGGGGEVTFYMFNLVFFTLLPDAEENIVNNFLAFFGIAQVVVGGGVHSRPVSLKKQIEGPFIIKLYCLPKFNVC